MIKLKLVNKYVLLLVLLGCLSGCWDRQEIDKRAYVLGIGLDKTSEEGLLKVTYLISNPEVGSTAEGGSSNEPSQEIISFDASSFIDSIDIANSVIAKQITYDILDIFVVSEELAKDKDFIRWIYDATKDREVRRDTKIIVTKETAQEFIKNNKPKFETRQHEYFELILNNAKNKGFIPNSQLHIFYRITEADAELFLATFATTKEVEDPPKDKGDSIVAGDLNVGGKTNPTQFLGAAVFKEGKMIGKITGEEVRLTQLLNIQMEKGNFLTRFPDPFMEGSYITARVSQQSKPKVTVDVSGHPPKINVLLPLKVEVLTDHSMVNYAKTEARREKLKRHLKERFEERYTDFIAYTQEEFKAGPFGFSLLARRHFLTNPQWAEYDWMKSYPEAKVSVKVEIQFGEFGRQSELPKYHRIRD